MSTWRDRAAALILLAAIAPAARASDEAAAVTRATRLLEEIASNPESGIPERFLREARGILIVPGIVETQVGVGRKKGHGVFLPRDEKGAWGDARPVEVSGASVGAIAGREVTDLVILYRTKEAAEKSGDHSLSLSASAHVLVSWKRKHAFHGPRAEDDPKKDVLTYTRNRGVVVGVAMGGEDRWGPATESLEVKTPPRAGRVADSPEVARLKAVLASMTKRPAPPVAASGEKDAKVSPASGSMPPGGTAAPPRR